MKTESLLFIQRTLSYANSSWMGITLLSCLILALFIIGIYKRQYIFQLQGFFSTQNRQVSYTLDETNSQGTLLIWAIAVMSYGIFFGAYFSFPYTNIQLPPLSYISLIIGITGIYFSLKYILFELWGRLFQQKEILRHFRTNYFLLKGAIGIIILPLLFILFYCPQIESVYMFAIIWLSIFIGIILSLYKCILVFFRSFLSFIYIILYLCILEILPIFLLEKGVKLLITNV